MFYFINTLGNQPEATELIVVRIAGFFSGMGSGPFSVRLFNGDKIFAGINRSHDFSGGNTFEDAFLKSTKINRKTFGSFHEIEIAFGPFS